MNSSLGSSPTSASAVTIRIPERGNSHLMHPIQTEEKFTTTSYPSNSRNTSVQPPVVKEETTKVSIPISTERQENGRARSVIKITHFSTIPTSQVSVSDKANPSESRVKRSTNLSMAEFHASKTCCNSGRENLTLPSPKAAVSDIAVAKVEAKKESTHVPLPDQCILNKIETERVSDKEEYKPLMNASQRIASQPSPSRKSMKTRTPTRRNQQTSENAPKNRKRPAEKALPFVAKLTRVNNQAFTTARSTPLASVSKYASPPQNSESRGLHSDQNEKSIAARPLCQRHSKVASSTSQGYAKAASFTEPSEFPITTSSMTHHTPVTPIHVRKDEQTMMAASSQIRARKLSLSPKPRSMVTSTVRPAMQKSIAANPVPKQRITSQSPALLTNADDRGLPKAALVAPQTNLMTKTVALHCPGIKSNAPDDPPVMHAIFQASPTVAITPPQKGNHVKPNNADQKSFAGNRPEDSSLPGEGTSASHSRLLKICSVRQCAPVSSSISDILQSIRSGAKLHRTNEQNKAATMIQRHAAKDMASKTTYSTSLFPTTRKVTVSARKPAVEDGSENLRSNKNVSVIPANVQEHVTVRPPDVDVKQENTLVFQPRVTHSLPGNFRKCENQNITMITQGSSGLLLAGSHTKQVSVNHPYMKRRGATIPENRIETSNGKPASVVETELISRTVLNRSSTKTQGTKNISHHSITNKKTRPMKPTSIVKEESFLPISATDKTMTAIGVSLAAGTNSGRLSYLPKAENQCGTNRLSEKRKMATLVGEENAKETAGPSAQLIAPAAKPEPMLQSAAFEPKDSPERTKPCKMSRSRRSRRDTSIGAEQNGSGIIANMTGSHYATPNRIAKQRVKKKSPGNRALCPRETDHKTQPVSSSSTRDISGHTEGLMVVELPYGRTRTITLKEDDMERHIPVWNTQLKYKVAGTAAPLGKNIARYLDRKKGEFEVYDEQERYEPEHMRKGARVTIWHKIEKRKISGTSAPLRKNIERYLRAHPHCEEYVDQQSKLDPTEKKNANARVTVWNKEVGRKQGFGQSGPLRKNLQRYLLRHPHLEEYNGQDIVKSGDNPEELVQEAEVTEKGEHNQSSLVHNGNSQDIVDPENREVEAQNANVSEGYDSENLVDGDEKLQSQLLDPSEDLDEAGIFEDCNSEDPIDACFPLDMSNIPDLNTFPFHAENVDLDRFELDPDSFSPPRHVRQLENVSDICIEGSIPETEREIHFQYAVDNDMDDDFIGEVVPDQMDIEANFEGDLEPLPLELEPLDSLQIFPDLELDGVFRPEDLIIPLN